MVQLWVGIDGLVQERRNSSALAVECYVCIAQQMSRMAKQLFKVFVTHLSTYLIWHEDG